MPLLSVSAKIDSLLKEMLTTFPSKGEVTVEEIEHWHRDLQPFPLPAIEWSFDTHRRNGRFFPLYGEILDLCISWEPAQRDTRVCDAECRKKHGTGYGENHVKGFFDVTFLGELVREKIVANKRTRDQVLTDDEIEQLCVELDKKRGGAPVWRTA